MFNLLLHLKGSDKWMKVEHLKDCTVIFSNKNIFFIVTSFLWHTKKFFQRGLTEALVDTYLVHKYLLHSFQKWNISWIFNVLWAWHCNSNCLGNSCKNNGTTRITIHIWIPHNRIQLSNYGTIWHVYIVCVLQLKFHYRP